MPYYLTKKGAKTWVFGEGEQQVSQGYFRTYLEYGQYYFEFTEPAGADIVKVLVSEIIVKDDTNGGIETSYPTGSALSIGLEGLDFPFFFKQSANSTVNGAVSSVFSRTGDVSALEGDYSLNLLGDVTISNPQDGDALLFNSSTGNYENQQGGTSDHGGLTGLLDDDHTQYLTEARHDALPSDNPHGVTASQVGLGNVDNTSDVDKPVSTAQQTALDDKEDDLGNPTVDGQVASSLINGTRSWISVLSAPIAAPFTTDLTLNQNLYFQETTQTGAINFTLEGTHTPIAGTEIVAKIISDGMNSYNFTSDFGDKIGIQDNQSLDAGGYKWAFVYNPDTTKVDVYVSRIDQGIVIPVAPLYVSSEITNDNPDRIVLTYDADLDTTSTPLTTDFSENIGKTITGVSVALRTVTLTVDTPYTSSDVVTVSFTNGTPPLQGVNSIAVVDLTNESVTNSINASEDAVWTNLINSTDAGGGTLTGNSGTQFTYGGNTTRAFNGDGSVDFGTTGSRSGLGFAESSYDMATENFGTIDIWINFHTGGNVRVLLDGSVDATPTTFTSTDVFRLERVGTLYTLYKQTGGTGIFQNVYSTTLTIAQPIEVIGLFGDPNSLTNVTLSGSLTTSGI